MTDEDFERLMQDATSTYRTPPTPDLDAMWLNVAARTPGLNSQSDRTWADTTAAQSIGSARPPTARSRLASYARIAATLVIGIGLGRASLMLGGKREPVAVPQMSVAPVAVTRDTAMARPYELETSQYLGQTAALLVALPSEVRAGGNTQQFTVRAGDLLARTRLLMDSPAANDPAMRSLFDDLELVLVQVVRLQGHGNHLELDLINHALEQRDVIPRLRTAAADISAN